MQKNPSYLQIPDEDGYERTIIVGDIHGCFDELNSLLDQISFSSSDLLISVGDLVDRGPEPWAVTDFFRSTPNAYSALGNHERRIAGFIRGTSHPAWTQRHSLSKLALEDHESRAQYFESLPAVIETSRVIVSHARLDPDKRINEQDPYHTCAVGGYAIEIEMEEGVPVWFKKWCRKSASDKPICIGHISYQQVEIVPRKLYALDTSAAKAGFLTALILPEFSIASVKCDRNYYEESRLEWLETEFLATPVGEQPIHKVLDILKKDHPHAVEAKAIQKFNSCIQELDFKERATSLKKRMTAVFGVLPHPGPARGTFFLSVSGELPDNTSKIGRWILAARPFDVSVLLKMYEGKNLIELDCEFKRLENWVMGQTT